METSVRNAPEQSRYEIRDGDRLLGIADYADLVDASP